MFAAAPWNNSAILFGVRFWFLAAICLGVFAASVMFAQLPTANSPQQPVQSPAQQPSQTLPAPVQQAAPAIRVGPVIVIDAAHGGTDTGARGAGSTVEKDVVLTFARLTRAELDRQGFHVVMTRTDDSNPSYDDRAAIANAHRDAVFISLHVSSTGTPGIARVYSYLFSTTVPISPPSSGLVPWNEAQQPYTDTSHRLADILQLELAQRFTGSPAVSEAVPIRELRSIAAPAVAIEMSSVSVTDPHTLTAFAPPLVTAIARGLLTYRPTNATGAP